jgi:hypothetical protein
MYLSKVFVEDIVKAIALCKTDGTELVIFLNLLARLQVVAVHVEPTIFDSYYNGCCNGTFWPLFHSMPDRATFIADHWKAYSIVNEEFAAKTVKICTPFIDCTKARVFDHCKSKVLSSSLTHFIFFI